ncbi:MAG: hypothetical protein K2P20_00345, partial [Oscillospiraceae bacterium]|nr:hypothetical protein [Oscillospiraceae bacterium]
ASTAFIPKTKRRHVKIFKSSLMRRPPLPSQVPIAEMTRAAAKMVTRSVDSFVQGDFALARAVMEYDDVVDQLFVEVKEHLTDLIRRDESLAGEALDLLMIAKYLERIGDHAVNVAEWVIYAITGSKPGKVPED